MSQSLQFFSEKPIDEKKLLGFLNIALPNKVESLELPFDAAKYFVQIQEFPEDFPCGINISWGDDINLNINDKDLATSIAFEFKTSILFEPENIYLPEGIERCLIDSNQTAFAVKAIECNGGLQLITSSRTPLL